MSLESAHSATKFCPKISVLLSVLLSHQQSIINVSPVRAQQRTIGAQRWSVVVFVVTPFSVWHHVQSHIRDPLTLCDNPSTG